MNVWWLGSEKGQGNFGDILTPAIFNFFNIKYNFVNHYSNADAICVGSIARRAGENVKVLGSGIIKHSEKLNPNADWLFVRGPITRDKVLQSGGSCPNIYGDPALLLPRIYNPNISKTKSIGYVPHFVDFNIVKKEYGAINLKTRNYKNVIDQILTCEKIVSSSLHGVIVAHAYGIPAAWVNSINVLKGDNVKFKDYFASIDVDAVQSTYYDPVFIEPGNIDINPIVNVFKKLA